MKHLAEVKLRELIADVLMDFLLSNEKTDVAQSRAVERIMAAVHAIADGETEAAR